jgi:hypothetical protein
METLVQSNDGTDDAVRAFLAMIVLLICVECAKEPEYRCEKCDKVYKQETRYRVHITKCVEKDTLQVLPVEGVVVSAADFSELLSQNREMMVLLQKQQETIQLLVAQLLPVVKMNIE